MGIVSMCNIDADWNLLNVNIADNLDNYYSLKRDNENDFPTVAGLDQSDEPFFFPGRGYSILADGVNYRMTKTDMERCTILIPDISLLRPGDLLVNNGIGKDPHIGIVVSTFFNNDGKEEIPFGLDAKDYWEQVMVVSIRPGTRTANLGTWGNPGNIFGGFTYNPENYCMRRLVKVKATEAKPEAEEWMVDDMPTSLVCDIIPLNTDNLYTPSDWHWLPNTLEIGNPFTIKIAGKDEYGHDIEMFDEPVTFLAPVDQAFEPEKEPKKNSNIYVNRGSGIELIALTEYEPLVLVTFTNNYPGTKNEVHYNVEYNPNCFDTDGYGIDGFKCKINNSDLLEIYCPQKIAKKLWPDIQDIKEFTTMEFALRATGSACPGDDFLLRFGYHDVAEGVVCDGDFFAVYDKKLLWRANLYIDERYFDDGKTCTESNIKDWNDVNPWNSIDNKWLFSLPEKFDYLTFATEILSKVSDPQVFSNSYELIGNYYVLKSGVSKDDKGKMWDMLYNIGYGGTGGQQIRIREYTPVKKIAFSSTDPKNVYSAVAYSWADNDKVEDKSAWIPDFNISMDMVKATMITYYNSNEMRKALFKIFTNEDFSAGYWDDFYNCRAPGHDWLAYVGEEFLEVYYDSDEMCPKKVLHGEVKNENLIQIGDTYHYFARPTYSAKLRYMHTATNWAFGGCARYSVGVQCNGLVGQAAK